MRPPRDVLSCLRNLFDFQDIAMAQESGVGNEVTATEQTPLIEEQSPVAPPAADDADDADESTVRRSPTWYLWRLFWAIAAVLVITAFATAWIEAGGDVEVCSVIRNCASFCRASYR